MHLLYGFLCSVCGPGQIAAWVCRIPVSSCMPCIFIEHENVSFRLGSCNRSETFQKNKHRNVNYGGLLIC